VPADITAHATAIVFLLSPTVCALLLLIMQVLTATYHNAVLFALTVDFALLQMYVTALILALKVLLVLFLFAVLHAKEELAVVPILVIVVELATVDSFVKSHYVLETVELELVFFQKYATVLELDTTEPIVRVLFVKFLVYMDFVLVQMLVIAKEPDTVELFVKSPYVILDVLTVEFANYQIFATALKL